MEERKNIKIGDRKRRPENGNRDRLKKLFAEKGRFGIPVEFRSEEWIDYWNKTNTKTIPLLDFYWTDFFCYQLHTIWNLRLLSKRKGSGFLQWRALVSQGLHVYIQPSYNIRLRSASYTATAARYLIFARISLYYLGSVK